MSHVFSIEEEFELDDYHGVPEGVPYRSHIQDWYDEDYLCGRCVFIKVKGLVWYVENDITTVIVVIEYTDYDNGDYDCKAEYTFQVKNPEDVVVSTTLKFL